MSKPHFTIYSSMKDDFLSAGQNSLAYKVSSHMLLFSQVAKLRKFEISHSKEGEIIRFDIYPEGPYESELIAELCKIFLDLTDNTSYDGAFDVPDTFQEYEFSIFELFEETDKYLKYIDIDYNSSEDPSNEKLKMKMLQMLDVFFGDMEDYPYSNFLKGLRLDTIDYITEYLNFHAPRNMHEKEFPLYNNNDFAVAWTILKVQENLEKIGHIQPNSPEEKLTNILRNFSIGIIYGGSVFSKLPDIYGARTLINDIISQDSYYYQFILSFIKNKLINIFENDNAVMSLFIDLLTDSVTMLANNYFDFCVFESIAIDLKSNL